MKNKEELKSEIYELAKKISQTSSDASLLEAARDLYEKSILWKHAPDSTPQVIIEGAEKIVETIQDTSAKNTDVPEKPQVVIDLFSSQAAPAEPLPTPAPEKSMAKERKEVKKKPEGSVAEKLQHKKITDLKASIGINEKFQFINELFDGNMKEYNVAVDQINSFSSFEEADSYIANLEDVYKWKTDDQIVENFKALVQRRFA